MIASKHNILGKIKDSEEYFIVNPLTQEADIITANEFENYSKGIYSADIQTKGYITTAEDENKLFKSKYLEFIDNRDSDEIQIFFVPWYTCNFSCSYCFQDEYTNPKDKVQKEVIDSFFTYITKTFSNNKYITLFGGEPLILGDAQKETIRYFIQKANEQNLDIAVVTNGYTIEEYLPILQTANIREIQITLDGTQEMHDKRRMLKGGNSSFENIAKGVDVLLQNSIPVNLRMVIDKENINELPKLAQYAIAKGWTKSAIFKTQLGRNYELHHCQTNNQRLYTRIEMYEDIYLLIKKYPEILEFHKPAFSISKFLWEQGSMPDPLFDSCTGTKTEWAFDYTGSIYSCTATVGKTEEKLGSFYPEISLNIEEIEEWQERDVLSIQACKSCNLQLACGGGCAAVAKNRTGKVLSEDCRPISKLLSLGIGTYFAE